jgi:hypothetical protein
MAKIKLDLDSLQIESFDTVAPPETHGTVRGHDGTERQTWCGEESCDGTCYTHCWGGCGDGGGEHGPSVTSCTAILNCEYQPASGAC